MHLWEREHELDRLIALLDDAASGSGHVLLVRGEAGIGKSALVREFLASVADEARVLTGWCDDLATPRELGPLWDMSRDEPSVADALETGDRPRIFAAAVALLGAHGGPTVMVMEDVQWADRATLDLITVLGRRVDRTPGLLVLTYRDDELDAGHRLRLVIGDLPPQAVQRIPLTTLSRSTVEEIATRHGRDVSSFVAQSAGNPFYVSELLASDEHEIPLSVQEATVARLLKANASTRDVVELVSVVPGGVTLSFLDARGDGSSALDEAVRRGMLVLDGNTVSFRHELARRAIESSLATARRRELNGRVLAALVEHGAAPTRIVHHAAEAQDVEALVEYGPLAGRQAMVVQSYSEALSHYRRLGPHLDRIEPTRRAELFENWSYAAELEGRFSEATERARQAVALWRGEDDPGSLGRALRRSSRASWTAGDRADAEAALDEAISILADSNDEEELAFAYSASAQLAMLARSDDAVSKAESALALAEQTGADVVRVHALVNKGTALSFTDPAAGDRVLSDAIAVAREIGADYELVRALVNRAWTSLEDRRLASAAAQIAEAIDAAFESNLTGFELYARAIQGQINLYTGDWLAVEDLAAELVHGEQSVSRILLLTVVGRARARRGVADAPQLLDEAWELATRSKEYHRMGYAAASRAELAWIRGEPDDAGPRLRDILGDAREVRSTWLAGSIAYWAWKRGHLSAAPEGIAEPHAMQIDGRWGRAAAAWQALDMPYERALALSEGNVAARLDAVTALDGLGADAVAAKVRLQLRNDGVRNVPRGPHRTTKSHPAGLTPRQSEILALLAVELTNLEIADRLFISARTVEHHVSAILAKLGVGSRDEAVTVGHELRLIEDPRPNET